MAQDASDGLLALRAPPTRTLQASWALDQDRSFLDLFAFLTVYFRSGIARVVGSPDGQGRSRTAFAEARFYTGRCIAKGC
jgi:hypothetical protein